MYKVLREKIEKDYDLCVRETLEDNGTLIGLPYKYTVPNVREKFQELYYWDTYFTNLGLIELGKIDLVNGNVNNVLFLVDKYGFMPNSSRTWHLDHSQPPFLSRMVKDLFSITGDKEWLKSAYQTLKKEYEFWQTKRILSNGLNAYNPPCQGSADGRANMFFNRVKREASIESFVPSIVLNNTITEENRLKYAQANLCFCESGWDYSSRFVDEGFNYSAIDLNSLLFDMEENMRSFSIEIENGEQEIWKNRSEERKLKMQALWSEKDGLFLDWNIESKQFSAYKSLASVYPMYAKLATKKQAEQTVKFIKSLETEYGFPAGEDKKVWCMQWDYPKIWAPLQVILYDGLMNYGYESLANRVAEKYIKLVEKQFAETGELWEKYDGVTGGHPSSACVMTGWTAAAYLYFKNRTK